MSAEKTASVVVFGHSHLTCLQLGYGAANARGVNSVAAEFLRLWGKYDPFVQYVGDELHYNEELVADLKERAASSGASAFVASLIGSEHLIWAVEGQPRPFDVVLPYAPALPCNPNAETLPYTALRAHAKYSIETILRFAGWLQNATKMPVFLVSPPPPPASDEILLNRSHGRLNELMQVAGVPHWTIRYKLWRIWIEVAAAIANEDNVKFVGAPGFVTDTRGLLLNDYCHDCVHGNVHYGYMAWLRILSDMNLGSA